MAQTRMTEGSIVKHIVKFAVPLFLGNLFQQLYNTVDSLIVGRMLGSDSLAAVSSSSPLVFLLVGFFYGVALGAGVVVAQYFGAGDDRNVSRAVHTTIMFALCASVFMTIFGSFAAPQILKIMGTPDNVMSESVAYVRVYFAGCLSMIMYNACAGIMQAVGDSRHPLMYLIISSCLNVILDIMFIGIFGLGVGGAALATVISQLVSFTLCFIRLLRVNEVYKVSLKKLRFHPDMLKKIIYYGLPSGLQNSVIAIANVFVQSGINSFGSDAMAGCGAYGKIEGFVFLPVTSFTAALTTFTGQNLGACKYDRAKQGAHFGIICSMIIAEVIGVLFYIFAPQLIGAFTTDEAAIAYGVQKARTCTLAYFLLAYSHCTSAVLRGAGKAVIPMGTMLTFWCLIRVTILEIGIALTDSIDIVNLVYPLTWSMSTAFLFIYYKKADWIHGLLDEKKKKKI